MNETARTIDNLLFYLRSKQGKYFKLVMDLLQRPGALQWSAEPHEMAGQRTRVRQCLPAKHHALLDLNLLVFLLRRPNGATSPDAATEAMAGLSELPPLFPPALLKRFTHWSWQAVAVPVVSAASAESAAAAPPPVWFLVAATDEQTRLHFAPEWVGRLLGRTSLDALTDALAAARSLAPAGCNNFHLFPLTDPHGDLRIEGRSLGLPLALGALAAATGRGAEGSWLATGDLRADGTVHEVAAGTLAAKANLAAAHKFRLFLYPQANHLAHGDIPLRMAPVSSLWQARLLSAAPGATPDAEWRVLDTALHTAAGFVNNCNALSPPSLLFCANEPAFAHLKEALLQDGGLFRELADKLKKLAQADLPRAEALAHLFAVEELGPMEAASPLAAFVWYSCNLALANHRGNNPQAARWSSKARALQERASRVSPKDFSQFVNRFYVDELHNRFTFKPVLPEEFERVLAEEERVHRGGCNDTLGALYGTLAQNFGFCGPDFIADLRRNVHLSQQAFGNGEFSEFVRDYRRGFAYLFAAGMDCGDFPAARDALWRFGGAKSWTDFDAGLKRLDDRERGFAEHMLARYLAHAPETMASEEQARLARELLNASPCLEDKGHPWQLVAHNRGLLAIRLGRAELAEQFWRHSLDLCLEGHGETMRIMALLPLSALHRHGMADDGCRQVARGILAAIGSSGYLDQRHFAPLAEALDEREALERVACETAAFFPFTYR